MKTLVIYTSMYGNTEKVALEIAGALGATAVSVKEANPDKLQGIQRLLVGSPTQAFNMLPVMKTWLKGLPGGSLAGVKVAAFDTRMDIHKVDNKFLTLMAGIFGFAAEKIDKALLKKGGTQLCNPEGFFVDGTEGPLSSGELERAKAWAKKLG